jgi:hypothetical protein
MNRFHPAPILRQALLADAATSGACALLMLIGSGPLSGLLGLPAALLQGAALVLIPWTAALAYLATRESLTSVAVWAVIVANAVWAADSAWLLLSGWVAPTAAGTAFVVAQALAVVMYAELQWVGLRRSRAAAA